LRGDINIRGHPASERLQELRAQTEREADRQDSESGRDDHRRAARPIDEQTGGERESKRNEEEDVGKGVRARYSRWRERKNSGAELSPRDVDGNRIEVERKQAAVDGEGNKRKRQPEVGAGCREWAPRFRSGRARHGQSIQRL
jgi:hypothetical protein